MSIAVLVAASLLVAFGFAGIVYAWRSSKVPASVPAPPIPAEIPRTQTDRERSDRGSINIIRPETPGVEGLEIQYLRAGIVRSVRVGAMNCEHKELLLTMDALAWSAMPNAQKQEVLAAARSTWAAKMCPAGPDIAYVVVKTERGEVVGRASPRTVSII